eukprot:Rhum_TRINITY_DN14135_c16_g1::Rhum_TRINITY_DN14135_c16_g1_i1::g.70533::m.70533
MDIGSYKTNDVRCSWLGSGDGEWRPGEAVDHSRQLKLLRRIGTVRQLRRDARRHKRPLVEPRRQARRKLAGVLRHYLLRCCGRRRRRCGRCRLCLRRRRHRRRAQLLVHLPHRRGRQLLAGPRCTPHYLLRVVREAALLIQTPGRRQLVLRVHSGRRCPQVGRRNGRGRVGRRLCRRVRRHVRRRRRLLVGRCLCFGLCLRLRLHSRSGSHLSGRRSRPHRHRQRNVHGQRRRRADVRQHRQVRRVGEEQRLERPRAAQRGVRCRRRSRRHGSGRLCLGDRRRSRRCRSGRGRCSVEPCGRQDRRLVRSRDCGERQRRRRCVVHRRRRHGHAGKRSCVESARVRFRRVRARHGGRVRTQRVRRRRRGGGCRRCRRGRSRRGRRHRLHRAACVRRPRTRGTRRALVVEA